MNDKFFSVEIIICFMDYTWNTDYIYVPCPEDVLDFDEAEFNEKAIEQWQKEEDIKAEQRGSVGPNVSFVGIYNVDWDETVDKDGYPIDE